MTNALLFALLLSVNWARIKTRLRTWFDYADRWASQRWPTTPRGLDDNGQLVEYRPRPDWDRSVTVEFHALIRHAYPIGEAT